MRKLNEELKNLTSEEEPDVIEHMTDAQFDAFERRRRADDMRSRIEQTRLSTEEREAKKRMKRERKERIKRDPRSREMTETPQLPAQ